MAELLLYAVELGAILRCPSCDEAVVRIGRTPRGLWLDLRGAITIVAADSGLTLSGTAGSACCHIWSTKSAQATIAPTARTLDVFPIDPRVNSGRSIRRPPRRRRCAGGQRRIRAAATVARQLPALSRAAALRSSKTRATVAGAVPGHTAGRHRSAVLR